MGVREDERKDGIDDSLSLLCHFPRPLALPDQVLGPAEYAGRGQEDLHRGPDPRHPGRGSHRGRFGCTWCISPWTNNRTGSWRRKHWVWLADNIRRLWKEEPNTKFFGNLFGGNDQNCGALATVKAITKVQATTREVTTRGTTKAATTRAAQTREVGANVTTARHSLIRMEGHMGPAEGLITLGAPGAIQLVGGSSGCGDLQSSKRFPNNPWSYRACSYSG